jgi:hypothetical protein
VLSPTSWLHHSPWQSPQLDLDLDCLARNALLSPFMVTHDLMQRAHETQMHENPLATKTLQIVLC